MAAIQHVRNGYSKSQFPNRNGDQSSVRLTGVTLSGGLQLITMNGKADGFQLFRPAFPLCHVPCIIIIAINPPSFLYT
jgi:hypothetical protein